MGREKQAIEKLINRIKEIDSYYNGKGIENLSSLNDLLWIGKYPKIQLDLIMKYIESICKEKPCEFNIYIWSKEKPHKFDIDAWGKDESTYFCSNANNINYKILEDLLSRETANLSFDYQELAGVLWVFEEILGKKVGVNQLNMYFKWSPVLQCVWGRKDFEEQLESFSFIFEHLIVIQQQLASEKIFLFPDTEFSMFEQLGGYFEIEL